METSAALTARYGPVIAAIETLIQTIFVAEIAIRLLAYWPRRTSLSVRRDFAVGAKGLAVGAKGLTRTRANRK